MNDEIVSRLDWDSFFFEREIGFYSLKSKTNNFDFDKKFDLVYIFSTYPLPSENFPKCIDKKIVYTKTITKQVPKDSKVAIYNGNLNQDLIDLSIQSGIYSRFKLDKKLSPYFEKLYTLWIKNSIENTFADFVLVYRDEDKIVGFLTLKEKETYFDIGLFAVSEKYRGKGIGTALLTKVDSMIGIGKEVRVVTQKDNQQACRIYEKHGLSKHSLTYIYHLWN